MRRRSPRSNPQAEKRLPSRSTEFSSIREYVDYTLAHAKPGIPGWRRPFEGLMPAQKYIDMLTNGNTTPDVKGISREFEAASQHMLRGVAVEFERSVAGGFPDVGAYLQGVPDHMWTPRIDAPKPHYHITLNPTCNASTTTETIRHFGAAAAALVYSLRAAGCLVTATMSYNVQGIPIYDGKRTSVGRADIYTTIGMGDSDSGWGDMATMLCYPDNFRRLYLIHADIMRGTPEGAGGDGYGWAGDPSNDPAKYRAPEDSTSLYFHLGNHQGNCQTAERAEAEILNEFKKQTLYTTSQEVIR